MAFPTSPTNGQTSTQNGILYTYASATDSWTRSPITLSNYVSNGNSNVNILTSNGNITMSVGGTSNIVNITSTGINIAGYANLSTGNLTANYITGTLTTGAQPNITSTGTLTALTVTGVVTATAGGVKVGNIQDTSGTNTIQLSSGSISVTGNITAGGGGSGNVTATYFIGNGSQLTGLPASYSNTNVAAYLPTYTGNVAAGNLLTNNLLYANGTAWSLGSGLTFTANTTPPATGNVAGDQWLNTSANVLYEYINDGTGNYWIDVQTPTVSSVSSALLVQNAGTNLTTTANTLNFTGSGVTATNSGNIVTVTIGGTPLAIQLEGTNVTTTANTINFVGGGSSVTASGNVVTVNQLSPFLLMGA